MSRRRIPWDQVAEMARRAGGRWRLHRSLAAADFHLLRHAQRRVPALKPTPEGWFEFALGNQAVDELGVKRFDLYVRFRERGSHDD